MTNQPANGTNGEGVEQTSKEGVGAPKPGPAGGGGTKTTDPPNGTNTEGQPPPPPPLTPPAPPPPKPAGQDGQEE